MGEKGRSFFLVGDNEIMKGADGGCHTNLLLVKGGWGLFLSFPKNAFSLVLAGRVVDLQILRNWSSPSKRVQVYCEKAYSEYPLSGRLTGD